jgi:anti-anti-sigma regulatory factor
MNAPLCTATRLADDGVLVATIGVGEIREPAVAYDLRNEMLTFVREAGTEHLIIDARNLLAITSVGFLSFLGVRREVKGRIVLCNLTPTLYQSFAVCRLIPLNDDSIAPFEVAGTLEEAIARLTREA